MADKRGRPGVGVAVFVKSPRHPHCILLGKRKNSTGEGTFALPGGHLEYGESWEHCGQRETLEETGLHLKNVRLLSVLNVIDLEANYHMVEVFLQGDVDESVTSEPQTMEPEKCEGWQWFHMDNLPPRENLFIGLREFLTEERTSLSI
ncbi:hypothetical protein ScPMuIL_003407 [Solemya velum]